MSDPLDSVPCCLRPRCWYADEGAYAYVVDAPLTFGHTQLVLKGLDDDVPEHERFSKANTHIAKCIKSLAENLPPPCDEWEELARYTRTCGEYQKTLVLRVSASEKTSEYKVHLVPYYESHFDETNRLYKAMGGVKAEGGLLHWLGQREAFADHDMSPGRKAEAVQQRIKSFNLDSLATALKPKEEPSP